MKRNVGETVYKYTLRKGKMFIHEGTVIEGLFNVKCVVFKDQSATDRLPCDDDFGKVDTKGTSLWLAERDDELARHLFVAYEEHSIAKLQEMINKKTKLIEDLKSGVA